MARRIPVNRTLHFSVAVPASTPLTEEQIRQLIEDTFGKAVATSTPVKVKKPRSALSTRTTKKAAKFPCRRKPDALHAAAITWPAGVPHEGCGRVFGSEKTRDRHEAGTDWNPTAFPNGCLDKILPAELRDDR